jgi:hypothetical protein
LQWHCIHVAVVLSSFRRMGSELQLTSPVQLARGDGLIFHANRQNVFEIPSPVSCAPGRGRAVEAREAGRGYGTGRMSSGRAASQRKKTPGPRSGRSTS